MYEPLTPPDSFPYDIPEYVCDCGSEDCYPSSEEGGGNWIVCNHCGKEGWSREFTKHLERL